MKSFIVYKVLVQWSCGSYRRTTIKTKWVEIAATDISIASEEAIKQAGNGYLPRVSMIWPKTEYRIINGIKTLVTFFTDGLKVWDTKTDSYKYLNA